MSLTRVQLCDLGFVPTKRGGGLSPYRKYDTLLYPLNDTDFLYIGYNQFNKSVNNKVIWKSFKAPEGRITYPVVSLGETGYYELKDFLMRAKLQYTNAVVYNPDKDPFMDTSRDRITSTEINEAHEGKIDITSIEATNL